MKAFKSKLARTRLNIGRLLPRSRVNGPGVRFVIWLQGCSLKCPGCINPEFLSPDPGNLMSVLDLYEAVTSTTGIEGVTYSGGEPFEQAKGLCYLSKWLKKAGLTIMSYSGYTYNELAKSKDRYVTGLLATLDILVDSRFKVDEAVPLLWRGSRNQKIHFFTEKYRSYEKVLNRHITEIELSANDKTVFLTGNFDTALFLSMQEKLMSKYGIVIHAPLVIGNHEI